MRLPTILTFCALLAFCFLNAHAQYNFAGSFTGATPNGVLLLNFTFPTWSPLEGNATFQMTNFNNVFPQCPEEAYIFTPVNSVASFSSTQGVPLGVIQFSGMNSPAAATDCMAVQLQWMWITGFELTAYGRNYSSSIIDQVVLTAGAFSFALQRAQ